VGVTTFAEAAQKVMIQDCLASSESGRPGTLSTWPSKSWSGSVKNYLVFHLFRGGSGSSRTVNRGYYRQIYQGNRPPVTRTHIDTLFFEKGLLNGAALGSRQERARPTDGQAHSSLSRHLDWLRKTGRLDQSANWNSSREAPAVCGRSTVSNVARMKELTEEKRFALAAALLFAN